NRVRKIHSDHQPRLLALKRSKRRRLSGDSFISTLPAFEVDARIDQGVGEVTDQLDQQSQQGEQKQGAEHHRVIAVERRLEAEQAQPVQGEDHLDEQGTGEEHADERGREAGDDDQHGVAEHMAIEHAVGTQALGLGGDHVLLADLVEEAVLGQQREGGEVADHQGRHRQRQVPEVVADLAQQRQLVEVAGGEAAQREPVEVAAAGEQHDQQDGEQERRNGVADDDRRAGPDVERAAVAGILGDAQRNGDQVHDQRAPQPQGNRDRYLFQNQVGDLGVAEEAFAEVEPDIVLQHQPEAFMVRLVEAVHALDFGHQFGVQALGAAIVGAARGFRAAAGDAPGGAARGGVEAFEAGNGLFHRAAGSGLDDEEVDQQDAEQGRDDQQQAPRDVGEHYSATSASTGVGAGALPSIHQLISPTS